jgi:hypothetical protein
MTELLSERLRRLARNSEPLCTCDKPTPYEPVPTICDKCMRRIEPVRSHPKGKTLHVEYRGGIREEKWI